jgi:tRNA 2-selenouridine synthase
VTCDAPHFLGLFDWMSWSWLKAVSTGAMAGPSTADLFAALRDESAPLSADAMEAFASGVKLDLAAGGAECRAEVEDLVRASVACSAADRAAEALIVDVRSPGEFARGHVPGALNVPLFTDDERAKVGTAFAKQGRGVALVLGMKAVRPKLERLVNEVVRLVEAKEAEPSSASARARGHAPPVVYVHCWRGGMRSSSLTWLLLHATPPGSLDVRVVRGGYKAFRRFVLTRWHTPASLTRASSSSSMASSASTNSSLFEDAGVSGDAEKDKKESAEKRPEPRVCVVGGRTGVGKTAALLGLRAAGESVIDLEGLAAHSGSAFGWVGRPPEQPTSEHFGNLVAMQWVALTSPPMDKVSAGSNAALRRLRQKAPRWIFVEDEGPHVGKCSVDPGLFARMRHAPLVVNVVASRATRLRTLVEDYANDAHRADPAWQDAMDESVGKLRKRLGNERAEALRVKLREGDFAAVADGLLEYYDGLYDKHLGMKRVEKREKQAARKKAERAEGAEDGKDGDDDARGSRDISREETEARLTLEQAARAGKVVECRARAVGASDREGRHPDSLDVDALVGDILKTVAAFEAEEALAAERAE